MSDPPLHESLDPLYWQVRDFESLYSMAANARRTTRHLEPASSRSGGRYYSPPNPAI